MSNDGLIFSINERDVIRKKYIKIILVKSNNM